MDESLSLCQAVCGGNSNSMGFILMPQAHSSTSHTAILKNRRLLEDKAVAILESIGASIPSLLDTHYYGLLVA